MSATANLNQEQMHHTRNLIHRMDDILGRLQCNTACLQNHTCCHT